METDRLWLVPGINGRDNEPFLNMPAKEGDFRSFCGVDYSEKYLKSFELLFSKGLSVDGHIVTADRIYARTLAENESAAFYGNRIEKYV